LLIHVEQEYTDVQNYQREFDNLLRSIRQLPGFENFLLGPSITELKELAEHGPIVVFNVSKVRSDAFIIEKQGVRSIQLPSLLPSTLRAMTTRFLKAVKRGKGRGYLSARVEMMKVLEWLWDVAVEPVLVELGFTTTRTLNEDWPRVWWIGSGLLNTLPIHAAGYHDANPPRCTLDRIISSYAPSIRSLAYAWERVIDVKGHNQRAILIGMTQTPGYRTLPFVQTEIGALKSMLPDCTIMDSPTKNTVLSALEGHQIVHFSCHGSSSTSDPSLSKVVLSDWETNPLTVLDFAAKNLGSPIFAYLSACHAAVIRDSRLHDESIHLVSALQLAGFPSVIGSLWQVQDELSCDLSNDVYAWMFEKGEGRYLETRKSAEALHRATHQMRERTTSRPGFSRKFPSNIFVWAAYLHQGI
jgi:hypothetical protein